MPVIVVAAVLIGLRPPALAATGHLPRPLAPLGGDGFTPNVLPGLARATDLGPAPGATGMAVVVTIARPDPSGERGLLDALHDPRDPRYGRFLSPAEFTDRFGVPPARLDAVSAWLTAGGLRVTWVSAARDQVGAAGPAAAVSRRFGTPMHAFDSPDGHFLANVVAPRMPAELGITNVVGLNTAQRMRPFSRPHQDQCAGPTCTGGTTPADLWSVYQQPPGFVGHGERVAVFGAGATDGVIDDLRLFEDRFRLPTVPVRVVHPGGRSDDESGRVEWNLDTQAVTGMAPGLDGLDLYFGKDLSDAEVTRLFSAFTDDPDGPRQGTASFGECEAIPVVAPLARMPLLNPPVPVAQGLGNDMDATVGPVTRQAALEGKTIFASTGDTGSSCPAVILPVLGAGNGVLNQVLPLPNSPATLPYVVGVGGTVLYTDGAGHRSREYGWAFGGGGSAQFIPAPSYQRGTPGLTLPCVADGARPGPPQLCRGVPDVAAQSGDVAGNGYDIISAGRFLPGGGAGTSLSSPLWAGMWARVQSASERSGGLGFANFALYRAGKDPASYRRDFFDVSSTDVRTGAPAANGLYPALPGWDYVTGFGAPRVSGLICDLAHRC